jgi:DnaJ homolog subfamily A member 2
LPGKTSVPKDTHPLSRNPYQTLGLKANASDSEIKETYRKLAFKHHPDRGGEITTFRHIQEAFQLLGDPTKRRQYDQAQSQRPVADLPVIARQKAAEFFQSC